MICNDLELPFLVTPQGALVSVVTFRAEDRAFKTTHCCSHTLQKPSISPGLVIIIIIIIIIFIIIVYAAEVADKANINGRGRV